MNIREKAVVTLNQGKGKCVLVLAHGLACFLCVGRFNSSDPNFSQFLWKRRFQSVNLSVAYYWILQPSLRILFGSGRL